MNRRKAVMFRTITIVSLLLIGIYFVISISYTAKTLPVKASPGVNSSDLTATSPAKATLRESPPARILTYNVIVTNYGASLTVPFGGKVEKLIYDPSVVGITTSQIGNSTLVEVIPKEYFTQSRAEIIFDSGRTAVINLIGSFSPQIEILPNTSKIDGVVGDKVKLTLNIINSGLAPDVIKISINTTPDIEVNPTKEELYLKPNDIENITLSINLKSPGSGGVLITAGNKTLLIPVLIKPPFTIENYTKNITPGGNISIEVSKSRDCEITVAYGNSVLYADDKPSALKEKITITPPVSGVSIIPLTVSGCGYSENLLVSVKATVRKPKPTIEVTPIGTMVFAPGVYEMTLRNTGTTPVNVSINVEHSSDLNVTYPEHVTLKPGSLRLIKFNISIVKLFTSPEKVSIILSFANETRKTVITVVPSIEPKVKVSMTPISGEDGITSATIELEPNIPLKNATVSYSVRALYNSTFVTMLSTSVVFKTLEKTEIILPKFPPTSVMLISVKITADGKIVAETSKIFVFKKLQS